MARHTLKPAGGSSSLPLPKDVETLHANGSASLAELKEFLGGLHGKSPQEVIGIVSSSLLIQSFGVAIVATIALLSVFTVGPYLIYGPPKAKEIANKPAAAAPGETAAAGASATATSADAQTASEPGQPDAEAAAKALGIDETKSADPNKNPLDKGPDLDNLLDGVP
jgi:hypothetical protein